VNIFPVILAKYIIYDHSIDGNRCRIVLIGHTIITEIDVPDWRSRLGARTPRRA